MKTIAALMTTFVVASFAIAETTELKFEGAVTEVYKKASGDDLRIYIFNPAGHKAGDSKPAIVFFFGGGWNGGTPGQFEQHCRFLASRGMVAMTADYRVKTRQGTTPKECVADGKSAVRWVRANAKRLGVDPDRIAAGGGSAGGHVGTTTGVIDGFDDPSDDTSVSSRSNALVLFNPVYDNGPKGYGHERVKEYWEKFSPAQNITKDDAPAVVFLGTEDPLIPVATAEKFKADMIAAGLKSELHLYEGQPHGFFNQNKGGKEIFIDTLVKMDEFLQDIGYLEGEPTEEQLKAVLNPEKPAKEKKEKS
ncbi:MAG: alpha/beta hydrolase [Verrucomicrobiota bacterium]